MGTAPGAAATLDKAVAIEQRVDGALGWDFYVRKSSGQALANFASTPTARHDRRDWFFD
jgi:hypothetical protein